MKSEQIFRVIGHLLFSKKAVKRVDELVKEINKTNLMNTLSESPIKKAVCVNCNNEIYLFAKYESAPEIRCPKCGRKKCTIQDDWSLSIDMYPIVVHYLDILEKGGIVSKTYEKYCPLCISYEPLKVKDREMSCKKCGNRYEIKWVYTPPEEIYNIWEGGVWLEWYVKKLLINSGLEALQGRKIKGENYHEIEVDCILAKSNKIISIECRSKSFDKAYDEEPDIIKSFPFSDYVIFVTTTKIGEGTKLRYKKISPKCKKIFVEGKDIEKLPEIIANIR